MNCSSLLPFPSIPHVLGCRVGRKERHVRGEEKKGKKREEEEKRYIFNILNPSTDILTVTIREGRGRGGNREEKKNKTRPRPLSISQ